MSHIDNIREIKEHFDSKDELERLALQGYLKALKECDKQFEDSPLDWVLSITGIKEAIKEAEK